VTIYQSVSIKQHPDFALAAEKPLINRAALVQIYSPANSIVPRTDIYLPQERPFLIDADIYGHSENVKDQLIIFLSLLSYPRRFAI
jgi:hypothetical protein